MSPLIRFTVLSLLLIGVLAAMSPQAQSVMKSFSQVASQSPYAESLHSLMQLKLEGGSQVDEVLQLIKELLDQLKRDQLEDDQDHAEKMAQFNANIEILQVDLARLNTELQSVNEQLRILTEELEALRQSIETLERQLAILSGQEQLIRDARAADIKAYQRRVETANKVINALNLIIEKLTNAVNAQDAPAAEAVLAEVSKALGANHPIAVLITLTAKFDAPTVKRILEKLVQIRDGAVASLSQDQAAEEVAKASFERSIAEIEKIRSKLSEDLANCKNKFNQKTVQQTIAKAIKEQLLVDIPITEEILRQTIEQRDQFHAAYINRTEQRTAEIGVVEKAYNILFDHVDSVRKQEELSNRLNSA